MQFDPDHLNALAHILRRGSFELAAEELSVTPSAISQRIRALEDRVGAVLINRGTPCSATPAGARIAKHAEDIGLLEAQLARDLGLAGRPQPTILRIAVNADSLATWFLPALAQVDDILFELVIDDEGHSADWLKRGDVSAAVTALPKPAAGCNSYPLGALRYLATASPDFRTRWFANGVTPETASRAPCLVYSAKDSLQRAWLLQHLGTTISPPAHVIPSTQAFIDAAQLGLGWGMNPEALVASAIRNGSLVTLPQAAPLDVELNWQVSRIMSAPLAPMTQAVRRAAAAGLLPAA